MKKEKLQYNGILWMALNVLDIEVIEEKSKFVSLTIYYSDFFVFFSVCILVLHVSSCN